MLASLAALQLLVLSQVSAPPSDEAAPRDPPAQGVAQAPSPAGEAPANPPLPSRGSRRAITPATPRQLSLLSGESLGGGSASLVWAGWSSLGIMYGQGITAQDDLGAIADFEWAKTELRLGGFYRRPLGQAGGFDAAGRLTLAWYRGFGATWIDGDNHSDHGIEVGPGISFSSHAGGGIFSTLVEAPLTITLRGDGGLLFAPRISLAYEAPVYTDFTVGARLGVGYRAGSGDAPLRDGRGELLFLVLAGYQLL